MAEACPQPAMAAGHTNMIVWKMAIMCDCLQEPGGQPGQRADRHVAAPATGVAHSVSTQYTLHYTNTTRYITRQYTPHTLPRGTVYPPHATSQAQTHSG